MARSVGSSPSVTWPVTWSSCRPLAASRSRQRRPASIAIATCAVRDSRGGRSARRPWSPNARGRAPRPPPGPSPSSSGGPGPTRWRGRAARRRPRGSGGRRARTSIIGTDAAGPRFRRGPAVRSAAVTSGMDVSTPPVHDTSPGAPERLDGTEQPDGAASRTPRGRRPRSAPPDGSCAPSASMSLALAAFTVPAVVLWWHVWSGHPASALTCGCGDPAQEVWFMAWPAWAISHLHSVFFSGAVNVPHGANLLSNTSGPLIGVVLAPVTWLFGPVTATNVALTLAPALSAWACFAAIRPLVRWKAGAIPAALVYGYSSAIVTSLTFGHVSVTVLVIPPFLFTTLYEIVIRQEHSVRRDGLLLAALLVAQFFISPEILVMCLLLGVFGLLAVAVVGWRQARARAGHALPALGLAVGVTLVLLAYPTWYGLAGPQAVTGVLFALAPITGVPLSGLLVPGRVRGTRQRVHPLRRLPGSERAAARLRGVGRGPGRGGLPRRRPPPACSPGCSCSWRPPRSGWRWAAYLISGPAWLGQPWLPWRALSTLPVLKEILPDQFVPLLTLFLAFLLAVGLDALHDAHRTTDPSVRPRSLHDADRSALTAVATLAVAAVALVPVFVTFETPLRVVRVHTPPYLPRASAAASPAGVGGSRGPHRSLRRLGFDGADAVAGHAGHGLPTGRRRAQDARCDGSAGRVGRSGVGPPDPDRSDDQRSGAAGGDARPVGDGPQRPASLAGGPASSSPAPAATRSTRRGSSPPRSAWRRSSRSGPGRGSCRRASRWRRPSRGSPCRRAGPTRRRRASATSPWPCPAASSWRRRRLNAAPRRRPRQPVGGRHRLGPRLGCAAHPPPLHPGA